MSGLRERWIERRNAVLSSERFQRFAARFWLTRPVARRHARTLFDLVAGFTYSQVLAAAVRSGLLEVLAEGPAATAEVAERIDLPLAGAERLLRAAVALELAEQLGAGRWALGSRGAMLRGNGGIAEMIAHHELLYADLTDPLALLRRGGGGGRLSESWRYAESPGAGEAGEVVGYSALMSASQPLVAGHILDAYPFGRHRRLLDVGGGEGRFLEAVKARIPALELGLFDLPAVAERASDRLDPAIVVHGGSFFTDPLPAGYDLITLVRILHDHDDGPAVDLLRSIHAALPDGGRLLIAEPMAATRGAEPAGDAYFGMYLLAMGSGRPRTAAGIGTMLHEAGFRRWREAVSAIPLTVRIIVADH